MSAQPVDVLAVMQEFAIANGSLEMGAARQAVAEQQRILRQLATWNRNPNGDGDELSALCAAAEMLAGKASDDAPKFDVATLPAVAEVYAQQDALERALRGCRDMLRESAKQHRLSGDHGHGVGCDNHADAADAALARVQGGAA